MKNLTAFVLFAVTLAIVPLTGQSREPALSDGGAARLDAVLESAIKQGLVPGVVAMAAGPDGILYSGAFGLMDSGQGKPMSKDTIFRIASMTKPVTSVATMMLVEQGKLNLDDPVSRYLPSFKDREVVAAIEADGSFTTRKAKQAVLIRHLLSNTSGLAYGFANDTVNRLQQKTGKTAEELPLLYEPGTQWTYGGSTKVLGQVIEAVTGAGLDKFFDERIFKPLNLRDTSFAVSPEKSSRVATVHRRENGRLQESPNPGVVQSPVAGDGGLNSTAADYIKFLQVFLNEGNSPGGRLLSKRSIETMGSNRIGSVIVQTQRTTNPGLSQSFPLGAGRDKFGFGFQIAASNKENPDLRMPGSMTWAGIFNTHFWVDPERRIAAVVMMQVLPFYDESSMKVYQDFEAALGRSLR